MSEMKWAIITGADGGMGTEITRAVAKAGYRIIMACYHPKKAEVVRERLSKETGNPDLEVIAIDLKEVGFKQKVKDKSVKVKIISPRNDIGSFLVFDKNMARRCIKLGYNDTMKEFTLLEGNKYTFKKSSFDKFYEQYKEIYIDYLKRILKIEKDSNFFDKLIKISIYKRLLSGTKNKEKKEFINIIENLGTLYELDDTKIYTLKKYNKILKEKITSENEIEEVKKIELLTNEEYKVKYILKKLLKKYYKTFKNLYLTNLYFYLFLFHCIIYLLKGGKDG